MYIYYGLLTLSVIMFGVQFFFSDRYRREMGSGTAATFIFTFLSALSGVICLFAIKIINQGFGGLSLGFTWFTLLMATVNTANSVLFSFCSLKSLGKINLSLYSLFSMLGGMMLPFVVGLVFYNEPMTLAKGICLVLIIAALMLNVNFDKEKRGGAIYYAGIFVFNGMSGVISKIYSDATYAKVSAEEYSIWCAIVTGAVSILVLAILAIKDRKVTLPTVKATIWGFGGGALSRIANYWLLIALAFLPASAQYPFITGGVMIVSTVIAFISGQKPSKREVLAVALSFVGLLALVFIKI